MFTLILPNGEEIDTVFKSLSDTISAIKSIMKKFKLKNTELFIIKENNKEVLHVTLILNHPILTFVETF